jgi:methanogenic corrinoid protein MtbC1
MLTYLNDKILKGSIMSDGSLNAGDLIMERMDELVSTALRKQYSLESDIWNPMGSPGYRKSLRDSRYHFSYLAEALRVDSPDLFKDYVAWVRVLFAGLGFPHEVPANTLKCMLDSIREHLDPDTVSKASHYFETALEYLSNTSDTTESMIPTGTRTGRIASEYLALLLRNDSQVAEELILKSLDDGVSIADIYLDVLQPCQLEIGRLWQLNRISVAQEHYSTALTQRIISRLYPRIFSEAVPRIGRRAVAAAIGDELHEMGIRMVSDFLEMAGWDTLYLGANTPAEGISESCCDYNADLLCVSATISLHIGELKDLIEDVRRSKPGNWLKIMVGGYPFNLDPELWKRVGADGYARNAKEAVAVAMKLTGGSEE